MAMEQRLILTAIIVNIMLTSKPVWNLAINEAVLGQVEDESGVRKNFPSLFNSVAKNEGQKGEAFRDVLKYEVEKEHQAFDSVKDELRISRSRNTFRDKNTYSRNNIGENRSAIKRETHGKDQVTIPAPSENSTYDERYRHVLKMTLDVLLVAKRHVDDVIDYHKRLKEFDQKEIKYITPLLDELHLHEFLLIDIITKVLKGSQEIRPGYNFNPVNQTKIDGIVSDLKQIKGQVDKYKPRNATHEYSKICQLVEEAIRELPLLYKPVHELVVKLEKETANICLSDDERARIAEETTMINLFY